MMAVVMITFSEVLGAVLHHHRETRAMVQKTLSDAAKTTPASWSRFELGRASPTVKQLCRAAQELGVPAWCILKQAEELCAKAQDDRDDMEVVDRHSPQRTAGEKLASSAAAYLLVNKFLANPSLEEAS